jgi:hypothetical protein
MSDAYSNRRDFCRSVSATFCADCASSRCCCSLSRASSVARCALRAANVCQVLNPIPATSAAATAVAALNTSLFRRTSF